MKKNKIFDCITFFNENFLTNLRFEILSEVVDYFIVCESRYDHKGNSKPINFSLINKKFEKKVRHLIIEDQFPKPDDGWAAESYQRERIFDGIKDSNNEDYIIFSDSDEIPNPNIIKNLELTKKFGIFLQKFYVYKLNIYNQYETPWEGSRICQKKNLKTFTHLRKKILKKNIDKPFWKFTTEKKIELFNEGGWHFNNLYSPNDISKKLKTFPHKEFNSEEYSNVKTIIQKMKNLEDLFGRNHKYKKVDIDSSYPEIIYKNKENFQKFIL